MFWVSDPEFSLVIGGRTGDPDKSVFAVAWNRDTLGVWVEDRVNEAEHKQND